ncbi:cysteine--tRNA ligase [Octadecabacter sp. 1_MG-2023]|uniref:cysteine--tRNA ligase n=1 Tax=unclassified Octadecabacter TaxID=196158 RepID=UPI001C09C6A9|nr:MULTISPECIES: cysteine--tRNA ligase [unclassified Octadecabacter]MBU2993408.1 cysteine--tRNA ligase [Octadecabacter sp. B2R22]MDO6733136.1 cysteine--tRNA ligase [Octadecabacter sp. 1_MG-2023]
MTIRLYNTKTRKKVEFEPIDPDNVRMYVCGPTVYDRAHLGNARPVIVFDTLFRLLRHTYGNDHVTYVRNFTDVDDKINATALARKEAGAAGTLEDLIAERTEETIGWYLNDMTEVGALEPTQMPRATNYIAQMIAMIEGLIAKDHAYAAEGHALFRVRSYENYGALSGRSVDDMIAGARVEVAPFKEDPMDFVLWKPSSDDQPGWDSPWGRGRPGWHIECSAMAKALLGDTFDIHGGGLDLQFPHHEDEIAQSCCANDTDEMARYWMHNEMLQVEGKKMSKSLGNFFTVRDLLEQGVPGEVIRLVFLMTHYRKPMDWTNAKRGEAEKMLGEWMSVLQKHGYSPKTVDMLKASGDWVADAEFIGVLSNDLNTSGAISRMHVLAKAKTAAGLVPLAHALETLGLVNNWSILDLSPSQGDDMPEWATTVIDRLIVERGEARVAKDWGEADRLRDLLNAAGVQVTDVAGTASWLPGPDFDSSVLEALK